MQSRSTLRGWHTWWSVALALPIVIVSLTAIFIAHADSLGLKDIPLPAALRMAEREHPAEMPEVRVVHRHVDGTVYVGTKRGLSIHRGATLVQVEAFGAVEVRALASSPDGIFVATKSGLWRSVGETWERVVRGDAWSVSIMPDLGIVAAVKQQGVLVSRDRGATWQPERGLNQALMDAASVGQQRQPRQTLHKLVMDMHTGKAFVGKAYEWLWIDLVAGTMLLLSFTGLTMWWRGRRQQRRLVDARQGHVEAAGAGL